MDLEGNGLKSIFLAASPTDYLKFGSLGFAALILVCTAVLYQRELWKKPVDQARMRLLLYFMAFAFLLLLVPATLEVIKLVENASLAQQVESNKVEIAKLNATRTSAMNQVVGALQEIEHGKVSIVMHQITDPSIRDPLLDSIVNFCLRIEEMKAALSDKSDIEPKARQDCEKIRLSPAER
jgi:hypothetical protein